jgi:hypothetical protein
MPRRDEIQLEEKKWTHGALPISYTIRPKWSPLFDAQIDRIRSDIRRNRDQDRLIVYLSCPISRRGGGFTPTNLDVNGFTARQVVERWGGRVWVLNPGQYQMESREGHRLMEENLRDLARLDPEKFRATYGPPPKRGKTISLRDVGLSDKNADVAERLRPSGGDYMRMWTTVLAGDDGLGSDFDFYYFLGPSDVREFFTEGGAKTITAGVEEYFARKTTIDLDFQAHFCSEEGPVAADKLRQEFFRFYACRASAAFSKGCHDEWNILVLINERRLEASGIGEQIPAFFEGRQVDPASAATPIMRGYAIR